MDEQQLRYGCSWVPASPTNDHEHCHAAGTVAIHGSKVRRYVCPQHAYDLMTRVATTDGLAVLTTVPAQQLTA